MGAPAARIPHSPPFSLPSLRGRAEGRALMSFGRGSMGFRNNLVSSLGRRNGIETNFIKQISLKRALPPPLPIRTFTIPDPWEDSFLSWCKKQKQRVLFLSRNSRHPLFRFLFTGAAAPPSPRWDALRFPPPPPCCCSFPLKRLFDHEPEEHHAYSRARKAGHEGHDCAAMFAGCSLSLIDMALGKYDAAESPPLPTGYTDESYSYGGWARYNMK